MKRYCISWALKDAIGKANKPIRCIFAIKGKVMSDIVLSQGTDLNELKRELGKVVGYRGYITFSYRGKCLQGVFDPDELGASAVDFVAYWVSLFREFINQ